MKRARKKTAPPEPGPLPWTIGPSAIPDLGEVYVRDSNMIGVGWMSRANAKLIVRAVEFYVRYRVRSAMRRSRT